MSRDERRLNHTPNFLAAAGRHHRQQQERRYNQKREQNIAIAHAKHDDTYKPPPPIIPRESFESPLFFIPDQRYDLFESFMWFVRYILEVVWFAALVVGTVWKLTDNSLFEFIQFLTNWSWVIQMVFYGLDLLSNLDSTGKTSFIVVSTLYWLMNGLVWMIFFLMFEILYNNPQLLSQFASQGGVSLGAVFDGDRVYHVLPALISLAYLLLNRKVIFRSVEIWMGPKTPLWIRIYYGLYASVVSLAPIGIYLCMFNPDVVYGITSSTGILVLVALVGLVLFNVVPFICFVVKTYS